MKILLTRVLLHHRKSITASLQVCARFKSDFSGDDYQYIQKSELPTYHFQPSLPRLPIPELEKTCQRYLAAQKPLLSDAAYSTTEKAVTHFLQHEGPALNEELKAIDSKNKHTSYISGPWFDMYLKDRAPLPINYNPILVMVNDPKTEYNNQLIRATNLVISSARFMKSIRSGILAPEVYHMNPKKSDTSIFRTVTRMLPASLSWYGAYLFKAFPLDMSQYKNLFNSTRLPEVGKDKIYLNEAGRHVLVMRKGNFYVFDVIDKEGNILPPDQILACMKHILSDPSPASEFPVGLMTTGDRDVWARTRTHLQDISNKENLSLIDSSLFNLALDDVEIGDDTTFMLKNFLYGNGANRWFDKSFSLLVSKDGLTALNFEHSWGDGVAVLRYFQDVHRDSTERPRVHPDTIPAILPSADRVRRLDFKLDDKAKQVIQETKQKYEKSVALDLQILEMPGFGKKECKRHKVSPDAIMQLGFQVAYHQSTGQYVPTYESCSTAAFRHGRTETIRPCTLATKAFCDAVNTAGEKPSDKELMEMIQKCSAVHGGLTKDAAMGQGFDRHLFGLRLRAQEKGGPLPAIFLDPAYAAINHNVLSTSTLSSPAVMAGGFGPVVPDGFGLGYSIADDRLGVIVSSFPGMRNGTELKQSLKSAFENIYRILQSSKSIN